MRITLPRCHILGKKVRKSGLYRAGRLGGFSIHGGGRLLPDMTRVILTWGGRRFKIEAGEHLPPMARLESPTKDERGIYASYYLGTKELHVGQAFQPDFDAPSGWKA